MPCQVSMSKNDTSKEKAGALRGALRRFKHALLGFLDLIGLYSYRRVDQEAQLARFRSNHVEFRALLTANNDFLTIVAELEESRLSDSLPHPAWVKKQVLRAAVDVHRMVRCLNAISENRYPELAERYRSISDELAKRLEGISDLAPSSWVLDLSEIRAKDAWLVGGKMANLGEIRNVVGLPTPPGFAVTAEAYQTHDSRPTDSCREKAAAQRCREAAAQHCREAGTSPWQEATDPMGTGRRWPNVHRRFRSPRQSRMRSWTPTIGSRRPSVRRPAWQSAPAPSERTAPTPSPASILPCST